MKRNLKKAIFIALAGLSLSYFPVKSILHKPKKSPIYEYALSKGLETKIAKSLERLSPLDKNDKEFIDIISSYPKKLQQVSVNSDILDNNYISKKELENTKKATLEGIINPKETYAILANGSGPSDPDWYSQKDVKSSMANILSFYKLLKDNNVNDDNITLLMYNPSKINLSKLKQDNSYSKKHHKIVDVKKRELSNLLPSSEDSIKIDGIATKKNFLNAIRNLHSDYNDTVFIAYSNPGGHPPKSIKDYIGRENNYIEFSGVPVAYYDLNFAINKIQFDKLTIIQNSRYAANLLRNLNNTNLMLENSNNTSPGKLKNVLAITSPNMDNISNETFLLDFVEKYRKNPNQSIKDIMKIENRIYKKDLYHPQEFYFNNNGKRRSTEECPWFNKPLF